MKDKYTVLSTYNGEHSIKIYLGLFPERQCYMNNKTKNVISFIFQSIIAIIIFAICKITGTAKLTNYNIIVALISMSIYFLFPIYMGIYGYVKLRNIFSVCAFSFVTLFLCALVEVLSSHNSLIPNSHDWLINILKYGLVPLLQLTVITLIVALITKYILKKVEKNKVK